ncbi:paraquat-inducible protein A [Flavilitoribacter nigricans]|uniref:Paraquat-inducible protein A n=1 Tax=Flavilitoribacter nigricans (strain ATCC 23147 / DSM 23189 / NBRC 102662 / NCIMB 1420 / SS-2) TaxID=1122177 RepID=A0A2D0NGL1_FLAN2|nr:paraquat-inducible protein A [Flavilitoribacter nigricans]PHN06893.1 hypothetical protein CRP01_09235 [Flavilitoribacter nigricans DSM 23189 = NBRC 102662]
MPGSKSFLLLTVLFLIAAAMISFQIIRQAGIYQDGREAYTAALHFEKRLLDFNEWFDGDGWDRKQEQVDTVKAQLEQPRRWANYWMIGFGLAAVIYLLLSFRLPEIRFRTSAIIITALACLITGLLAPMLEIAAYQEDLSIPIKIKTGFLSLDLDYTQNFPGEMYFYYQSKSVLELIGLLFRQNNFVVGLSILVFSVLIPLIKNSLALASLSRQRLPQSGVLRWFLLRLGKWSMADVFVVAIFLGFLAFNNMQTGVQTESNILTGLYFFLAYALLAIWASVQIDDQLSASELRSESPVS